MDFETCKAYCATQPEASPGYPFGEEVLVFKVANKMFAIISTPPRAPRVTLKCEPEWARVLRETHPAVQPGYHTNKQHWNTVALDGTVPEADLRAMIDHAWERVVLGLPKAQRERLLASR
jgi:predicted DNA-binding protein (MmcQ/YjbR family)